MLKLKIQVRSQEFRAMRPTKPTRHQLWHQPTPFVYNCFTKFLLQVLDFYKLSAKFGGFTKYFQSFGRLLSFEQVFGFYEVFTKSITKFRTLTESLQSFGI